MTDATYTAILWCGWAATFAALLVSALCSESIVRRLGGARDVRSGAFLSRLSAFSGRERIALNKQAFALRRVAFAPGSDMDPALRRRFVLARRFLRLGLALALVTIAGGLVRSGTTGAADPSEITAYGALKLALLVGAISCFAGRAVVEQRIALFLAGVRTFSADALVASADETFEAGRRRREQIRAHRRRAFDPASDADLALRRLFARERSLRRGAWGLLAALVLSVALLPSGG